MAYSTEYSVKRKFNYKTGESNTTSQLKAEFRFKNEVPKKERGIIKKRMGYNFNCLDGILLEFLKKTQGINHIVPTGGLTYLENTERSERVTYWPNPSLSSLGFDISVYAEAEISREDLLDLEKLNKAILTGEM